VQYPELISIISQATSDIFCAIPPYDPIVSCVQQKLFVIVAPRKVLGKERGGGNFCTPLLGNYFVQGKAGKM